MKKLGTVMLAAAAFAFAALQQAEGQTVAGPYLAFQSDNIGLGVGGFVSIPLPEVHENFGILIDGAWYFPDGFNQQILSGSGTFRFPVESGQFSPFVVGGISLARVSNGGSVTDLGVNFGGGVTFLNAGNLRPSVGARLILADGSAFEVVGALSFPMGGS